MFSKKNGIRGPVFVRDTEKLIPHVEWFDLARSCCSDSININGIIFVMIAHWIKIVINCTFILSCVCLRHSSCEEALRAFSCC